MYLPRKVKKAVRLSDELTQSAARKAGVPPNGGVGRARTSSLIRMKDSHRQLCYNTMKDEMVGKEGFAPSLDGF